MSRAVVFTLALLAGAAGAQNREEKVRADRQKVEAEGFWIYNDLPRGFAEAKRTNKPMLVVLRCIPCEECVKLDDDLVNQDRRVRPLLEKFVRVRVVSTNGLDLSLFQFDYDQSFAAFLLNADGAIYGRFGTRSHRTSWSDDVSIEGLAKALQRALELHADYPRNKEELTLKKGPKPDVATPEKFPTLSGKYGPALNYAGKVVPGCIHCHQIGDAQLAQVRERGEAIPEETLFPYPHPKAVGLVLDPKECATVLRVEKGSPAEKAGFEAGDVVTRLGGQTPLSIADVQWVLHRTPAAGGTRCAEVRRGSAAKALTLSLPKGWRRADDISWRASTWGLRRMALGGLVLESAKGGVRVKHVGQYGPHAAAKNAGFRKGDLVVSFDGRDDFRRESDVLAHAVGQHKPGDKVAVEVLRDGEKVRLTLPMQK